MRWSDWEPIAWPSNVSNANKGWSKIKGMFSWSNEFTFKQQDSQQVKHIVASRFVKQRRASKVAHTTAKSGKHNNWASLGQTVWGRPTRRLDKFIFSRTFVRLARNIKPRMLVRKGKWMIRGLKTTNMQYVLKIWKD